MSNETKSESAESAIESSTETDLSPTAWAPKKKPVKPGWQDRFLREYAKRGNVRTACIAAGISRKNAYYEREINLEFAEAWDEAKEGAIEILEAEAHRRAAEGVDEPIYWQGEQVGTVRKYSDTLLIFLLKANAPEKYRETIRTEHANANGQPFQVAAVDWRSAIADIVAPSDLEPPAIEAGSSSDSATPGAV